MKHLRWIPLALVLTIALPTLPACHAPTTVQTLAGKAAFTANELLTRVERLQKAAIAAQKNGSLALDTARAVVFVTVNLADVADAATQGWQVAAKKLWDQAKTELAVLRPGGSLAVVAATVDELLGGVS